MELPGLVGSTILDVPVYVLDCFDADSGQPVDGYGQLVAAYGGAFRQLGGGVMKPSLRREELRFTGTWERLEFPIALVALLAATLLGLIVILQRQEIHHATYVGGLSWLQSSNNFAVGNPKKNEGGRLRPPIKALRDRAAQYEDSSKLPADGLDPIAELIAFDKALQEELIKVQREVGDIQEVEPPQSAFGALCCVLDVLEDNDAEWRVAIRRVLAQNEPPRAGKDEHVRVTLDLTFFAADPVEASSHYAAFRAALQTKPWFIGYDERQTRTVEEKGREPGEGGIALLIDAFPIQVDVRKYFETRS